MAENDPGFTLHEQARAGGASGPAGTGRTSEPFEAGSLPPLDFSGFVLGLGQMALVHLGEAPEPLSGEVRPDLVQARHLIDLLDLLDGKTRGNLSGEESALLTHLRSDLKLRYVRVAR